MFLPLSLSSAKLQSASENHPPWPAHLNPKSRNSKLQCSKGGNNEPRISQRWGWSICRLVPCDSNTFGVQADDLMASMTCSGRYKAETPGQWLQKDQRLKSITDPCIKSQPKKHDVPCISQYVDCALRKQTWRKPSIRQQALPWHITTSSLANWLRHRWRCEW